MTMQKDKEIKKLTKKKGVVRSKNFRCQNCGRPIRHQGNCLPCNLIAKYKKEVKKVT